MLVVDDHPDMLNMLGILMKRRDFSVKTASGGREALLLAPEFAPHIVVSDIGMPGMDGLELMEQMRSAPKLSPFKSIALTGYDFVGEPERALKSGYDAHIMKPIDFDHLFATIEALAQEMRAEASPGDSG